MMAVLKSAFDGDDDDAPVASSRPDAPGVTGAAGSADAVVQPAIASCVDSPSPSKTSRPDAAPAPAMADVGAPEDVPAPAEGGEALPAVPVVPAAPVETPVQSSTPDASTTGAELHLPMPALASACMPSLESEPLPSMDLDEEFEQLPSTLPTTRPARLTRSPAEARVVAGDFELHTLVCAGLPRMGIETIMRGYDSDNDRAYDSDDSAFEHGDAVHQLQTGRYSKLEGAFFGDEKRGTLTLHTKFVAEQNASAGYKTLERGMWVDCPGVPYDEVQLVRILSGDVAASSKAKAQKKYAILLFSGSEDEPEWFYAPMQLVKPLDGGILFSEGGPFHGSRKWMFSCDRHAADRALLTWEPQSISTLTRKAGELTPCQPRGTKRK